ncbi:Uma2 family endonuclease [Streptomyces sp. N35]|uniref:Uma2 family endonuclease n=1 Tax=Streptomyces sp. N35 TaxID=2795730 RepID=UPI0018F5937A|nr:Uma2 family endonuclease [Streptomyces sp. N35]
MTAAMVEPDQTPHGRPWDYLLQSWREVDAPEGWRAEIDEEQIVLVPPPHARHNRIAAVVQRGLYQNLPEELDIYQTLGLHIAPLDKLYVPDLVVVPSELTATADPDRNDPVDAAEALLVVEITSKGNAKDDRTKKLWAYAHAPVPVYVLIDRFDEHGPTTTVFSEPLNGAYKHAERVPSGDPLSRGAALDTTGDTGPSPR